VSRLDPFNRLNVSNAEGMVTFQHNVRVSQERWLLKPNRTLIIETQSDSDQDDLDEIVHHDPEGGEDDFDVDQAATLGCVLSMHLSAGWRCR